MVLVLTVKYMCESEQRNNAAGGKMKIYILVVALSFISL
jgi:hypothetical protein